MRQLGKLELVDPRTLWASESADFTPWLAQPENVSVLGEALGIELEVEGTEVGVGPYSADILARDTATDAYVVIENQIGKTDHDHLGKALTYAATLGAKTVVWIATKFTSEHRKVLDWLNDNTEGLWFYAVSLELWQIDGSKPAVRFNVLTAPQEGARELVRGRADPELTDTRRLQLEWWTAVREQLIARKVVPSPRPATGRYWFDISTGRTGFWLSCVADTWSKKIGVRLLLSRERQAALPQLLEQKTGIEREMGESLLWNPKPDNVQKEIGLYREADIARREDWPQHIDWMVERIRLFLAAFRPRIKALNLEAGMDQE